MSKPEHLQGGCLCSAVRYEMDGPLSNVGTCHCSQCRRWTGHLFASFTVQKENLRITGAENIGWYNSSDHARRGFCKTCGSSLFWEYLETDETDILAGTIDMPTNLKNTRHIFVADKGDYYDINDDVIQFPKYGKDPEEE